MGTAADRLATCNGRESEELGPAAMVDRLAMQKITREYVLPLQQRSTLTFRTARRPPLCAYFRDWRSDVALASALNQDINLPALLI